MAQALRAFLCPQFPKESLAKSYPYQLLFLVIQVKNHYCFQVPDTAECGDEFDKFAASENLKSAVRDVNVGI
ncbi:hypothetical protein ABKU80_00165 [Enterobacter mori]|jgi:hypothetical protein|uniref:hypothetical protein n=1 Tax=Enterobacter mori TaxID=539813 RepID=UPI0032AF9BD4